MTTSTWERLKTLQPDVRDRLLADCVQFTDADLEQTYDDMLDECTAPFMGTYAASDVLRAVDPVAYQCGLADFCSGDVQLIVDGGPGRQMTAFNPQLPR